MSKPSLVSLLETSTGPSKSLDEAIVRKLKVPHRDYSSSVDACLELIHQRLPTAHWHIGRAEDGVSVYATLNDRGHSVQSTSITVPLALLCVAVASLAKD